MTGVSTRMLGYLSNLHGIVAVHLDWTRGLALGLGCSLFWFWHFACCSIECGIAQQPMAITELFRKKYGMDFWRHELGAIVVVALKNTLKCSGRGYGRLPSPIGGRPIADFMTTKALEPDGERRFLLRLNHALILMSHALRFQTQPGTGRLLPKAATAGEWIPLGPLASILTLLRLRRHD